MSNVESLLGQAWDEYTKLRQGASPSLNGTLEDLWHKIAQMEAPTPEEEDARLEIYADLTERLAPLGFSLGGTLAAEAHGSFLMGCFNSSSTLEVAVTGKLPGQAGPQLLVDVELRSAAERLALLERIHSLVADCGIAAPGTVSINLGARVPSVSFEHASSGIPVRVCIAYANFALRPQVVRGLALLEPRLRSLIQLVELWAEARGLNNPAAGTFNSWALVNLVIFAAQTFQSRPLLPPLWRACGAGDPAAGLAMGAGNASGTSSSGGGAPVVTTGTCGGSGVVGVGGTGGGSGSSSSISTNGGAAPGAVRLTQRLVGLTATSEGLAPVLRDIQTRLTGPPEALGLLPVGGPAAAQDPAGLLPLFHWFLVLLDRLLAHWQLSWNRRWRVSTWWGQLVQQPFNRAFLVPVECPFDPADNAAKSLGCENQPRHQKVLREVVAEVAASLRLLQDTRAPEDLDRLALGMFGLEVEHLYLEEEEVEAVADMEVDVEEDAVLVEIEDGAQPEEEDRERAGHGAEPSTKQGVGSPTSTSGASTREGRTRNRGGKATSVGAAAAAAAAAQRRMTSPCAATISQDEHDEGSLAFDVEAVQVEVSVDDVDEGVAAWASAFDSGAQPGRRLAVATAAAAAPAESPSLPTSSAAVVVASSPAVLRANAMVQRPLLPLLRDVTNARQYGRGPEPKSGAPVNNPAAASTSVANSATESPGGESLLPFEGLFGSFLEGARRLFDNMAQGMAELGEDLNELAATTAATIRAVINDDEDLPLLGSSSAALRRQRRQRLQLLHRGGGGGGAHPGDAVAPSCASSSPASTSTSRSPHPQSQGKQRPDESPAPSGPPSVGRLTQPRASPLRLGVGADRAGSGSATPARRTPTASAASLGLRTPGAKAAAAEATPPTVAIPAVAGAAGHPGPAAAARCAARRRGEELAAALTEAGAVGAAAAAPPSPQQQRESGSAAVTDGLDVNARINEALRGLIPEGLQATVAETVGTGRVHTPAITTAAEAASVAQAAEVSGPGINGCGDNVAATAAAAATGHPVRLHVMPVNASDHPLVCSPVLATVPKLVWTDATVPASATAAVPPPPLFPPPPAAAVTVAAAPTAALTADAVMSGTQPHGGHVATAADVPAVEMPAASQPPPAARKAAPPLAVDLLQLGSIGDGGASTCGTLMTRASTPVTDASASTASSPNFVSSRSFAPTQPQRVSGSGLGKPALMRATTTATAAEPAPDAGGGGIRAGATRNAPPPPPPLPPPPQSPVGMGGLRIKSATFRKGATRDSLSAIISPIGNGARTPRSSITLTTSTVTSIVPGTPTTTTLATLSPSFAAAAAAAAAASGSSFQPVAAAAAAAAATTATADPTLQDPAMRTLIQLSSGRLQELAECIDRAGPGTTIDLQGNTFAGPLAAPAMKVTALGLWLVNGELALSSEQQLIVVAKAVRLTDVTIRDAVPVGPMAFAAGGTAPPPPVSPPLPPPPGSAAIAGGAVVRPALLVTKQSYVGGGELTLARCRLLLGASRGVGVQVKGRGCSAVLEDCLLRGSAVAAAQASDAALSLSRCTLEGGAGQGVCCRGNAAVAAAECRLRRFGGACAAVLAGASLELVGCTLSGAGGASHDDGDSACGITAAAAAPRPPESCSDGAAREQAPADEGTRTSSGGAGIVDGDTVAMVAVTCGPGVLAEGKGASLVARGSSFQWFRTQAALVVTAGAAVSLEDCRATDSHQGAMVGTRGGRLLAARCELSSHTAHGLVIGEGATADLRDCRLRANGGTGLRVGGVGSMAVLRGCELSRNAGCGVAVAAGGCANLDSCTASANGAAAAAATTYHGNGHFNEPSPHRDSDGGEGRSGHGLHVEGSGARVTALRCAFSSNTGAGVHVGAHGNVQLMGCGIHGNYDRSRAGRQAEEGGSSARRCCSAVPQPGAEGEAVGAGEARQGRVSEEGASEMDGGVEVEVEAHGRVSLSKGCVWGRTPKVGGGERGGLVAGGPNMALLVSELGYLELTEDA